MYSCDILLHNSQNLAYEIIFERETFRCMYIRNEGFINTNVIDGGIAIQLGTLLRLPAELFFDESEVGLMSQFRLGMLLVVFMKIILVSTYLLVFNQTVFGIFFSQAVFAIFFGMFWSVCYSFLLFQVIQDACVPKLFYTVSQIAGEI